MYVRVRILQHTAFNEALALKLFMFQFVNSYASLFFIAFWSRSFTRLQFQLFFVMFVGQLVQNFVELGVPALTGWIRSISNRKTPAQTDSADDAVSESGLTVGGSGAEMQMQTESVAKVYDEFALSEDYLEMTIQFGKLHPSLAPKPKSSPATLLARPVETQTVRFFAHHSLVLSNGRRVCYNVRRGEPACPAAGTRQQPDRDTRRRLKALLPHPTAPATERIWDRYLQQPA